MCIESGWLLSPEGDLDSQPPVQVDSTVGQVCSERGARQWGGRQRDRAYTFGSQSVGWAPLVSNTVMTGEAL